MSGNQIRIVIAGEDGIVLDVIDGIDVDDLRNEIERFPTGILSCGARSVESYFPEDEES